MIDRSSVKVHLLLRLFVLGDELLLGLLLTCVFLASCNPTPNQTDDLTCLAQLLLSTSGTSHYSIENEEP